MGFGCDRQGVAMQGAAGEGLERVRKLIVLFYNSYSKPRQVALAASLGSWVTSRLQRCSGGALERA